MSSRQDKSHTQSDDHTNLDRAARIQREYGVLWNQLDTLQKDLATEEATEQTFENIVVGTTAVSVTGLTAGYVLWLIRGGTLVASLVSSLPAWAAFDPLPVLDTFDEPKDREFEEDISFQSLVENANQDSQEIDESEREV